MNSRTALGRVAGLKWQIVLMMQFPFLPRQPSAERKETQANMLVTLLGQCFPDLLRNEHSFVGTTTTVSPVVMT
jgi:hypothetical protein